MAQRPFQKNLSTIKRHGGRSLGPCHHPTNQMVIDCPEPIRTSIRTGAYMQSRCGRNSDCGDIGGESRQPA
jgi:hypothetical protein